MAFRLLLLSKCLNYLIPSPVKNSSLMTLKLAYVYSLRLWDWLKSKNILFLMLHRISLRYLVMWEEMNSYILGQVSMSSSTYFSLKAFTNMQNILAVWRAIGDGFFILSSSMNTPTFIYWNEFSIFYFFTSDYPFFRSMFAINRADFLSNSL